MSSKVDQEGEPQINSFERAYPHITHWVKAHGWIEIGKIDGMSAFIMALDEGGLVWEGKRKYKTLGEAFKALEQGLSDWIEEQSGS
jgi:hypothetical protein